MNRDPPIHLLYPVLAFASRLPTTHCGTIQPFDLTMTRLIITTLVHTVSLEYGPSATYFDFAINMREKPRTAQMWTSRLLPCSAYVSHYSETSIVSFNDARVGNRQFNNVHRSRKPCPGRV